MIVYYLNNHLNSSAYEYQTFSKDDLVFLNDLHNNFVIVPVDKAANNFAIICKKFYIEKVNDELKNTKFYEKH